MTLALRARRDLKMLLKVDIVVGTDKRRGTGGGIQVTGMLYLCKGSRTYMFIHQLRLALDWGNARAYRSDVMTAQMLRSSLVSTILLSR